MSEKSPSRGLTPQPNLHQHENSDIPRPRRRCVASPVGALVYRDRIQSDQLLGISQFRSVVEHLALRFTLSYISERVLRLLQVLPLLRDLDGASGARSDRLPPDLHCFR